MRDRIAVLFLSVAIIGAILFWIGALYVAATEPVPDRGGQYTEGIVGQPQYINPLLSPANMADSDLVQVLYSGLFGYDENGRVVPQLAEKYALSEDGKTYTVTLRSGVKWHDGTDLSSGDVVFTVNAVRDPAYRSPLRQNWQGVEVSAPDARTVVFTLKKPYFGFLEHLTLGILPRHIWESIAPDRFALAEANLNPVGSGPYRFFDYQKDSSGNILSYSLRAFPEYFAGEAHITKLSFNFYPDEESMIDAYEKKEIIGMSPVSVDRGAALSEKKGTSVRDFHIPQVYGVFFNTSRSVPLAYTEVRAALARAVDREALVRDVLRGRGTIATSPLLFFMEGGEPSGASYDPDAANRLLDEKGWKRGADGIRAKDGIVLQFEMTVPDLPELLTTMEALKKSWEGIGARVTTRVLSLPELNQNIIRGREYDALLYGEKTSVNPDFYSFWHSSEKSESGLNLSLFNDAEADDLLFKLREEGNADAHRTLMRSFLDIIAEKNPAVFLYSPSVSYIFSTTIKGVDISTINTPSGRLGDMEKRYIKTKRVWKNKEK